MSTKKFKIFCTYKTVLSPEDFENVEITMNTEAVLTREHLLEAVKGCDGILSNPRCPRIDAEVLAAAGDQLKVISTSSAGFNYIDLTECTKRGIAVGYLANTFSEAVAEITVGLMLSASRKIVHATQLARTMPWNEINDAKILTGKSIRGSTIGIFGLGKIGQEIAKRLSAFNIKEILYTNRKPNPLAAELNYKFVDFNQLLEQSDYLICAASLNTDSEGMFNLEAFTRMKKSSTFVNVGRGGMVNHTDLFKALDTGLIQSAAIDVTSPEPLPKDHPLFGLSNCIITPHIAGDDWNTREDLYKVSAMNLVNGLHEKPLLHQIND